MQNEFWNKIEFDEFAMLQKTFLIFQNFQLEFEKKFKETTDVVEFRFWWFGLVSQNPKP